MDVATTAGMQEVERRRMPKPRAAMGQGWPTAAGLWNGDGVSEPRRSRGRMNGRVRVTHMGYKKVQSHG